MNTQKKIKLAGLVFIVLCGLFPPWINILDVPYHAHNKTPAGYGFIIFPPATKGGAWGVEIDGKRLLIEWVCIAATAGAAWIVLMSNNSTFEKPIPSRKIQTPRIVLLDDEPSQLEMMEFLIKDWCNGAILLKFQHGDAAWQELSLKNPDLFITDWNHPGMAASEILSLLAARKKSYPVLVTSGFAQPHHIQNYTKQGLKITLLSKPFKSDQFNEELSISIGQKQSHDRAESFFNKN